MSVYGDVSDVSYYKKVANGQLCACAPLSLGYGSCGAVVAIGPQINGSGLETEPYFQGTLQEKINRPAVWCHKIVTHWLDRAAPTLGSGALVIGAVTVGLLLATVARQYACTLITIAGVDHGRVNYSIEKGLATQGDVVPDTSSPHGLMTPVFTYRGICISMKLDVAKSQASEFLTVSASDDVQEDDEEVGVDVTFEYTGKEACIQTALYTARPGGKVAMVAMGTSIQTLPLSATHLRELDNLCVFRTANTLKMRVRLLEGIGKPGDLPSLGSRFTHRVKGLGQAGRVLKGAGRTVDGEGRLVLKAVTEP
ncbi:hypothetical protein BJ878DRAFT_536995 [Calycina marina]|uniref:Alcohol dehydrogenase n=1 Tax=Calycina marina TaxID=1763456 RepID=A0A9P7YVW9_9HELO|nr:hypothetical protein BJ878DRAFT_536995 [Calycina marina]